MDLGWVDQPEVLDGSEKLFSFHTTNREVEVRRKDGVYYLTVGNLFGSQTIRCRDIEVLFRAVDLASHRKDVAGLPDGMDLIENRPEHKRKKLLDSMGE